MRERSKMLLGSENGIPAGKKGGVEGIRLPTDNFVRRATVSGCQTDPLRKILPDRVSFLAEEDISGLRGVLFGRQSGKAVQRFGIDHVDGKFGKRINTYPRESEPSAEEWT